MVLFNGTFAQMFRTAGGPDHDTRDKSEQFISWLGQDVQPLCPVSADLLYARTSADWFSSACIVQFATQSTNRRAGS
jgi:hypothetical protein